MLDVVLQNHLVLIVGLRWVGLTVLEKSLSRAPSQMSGSDVLPDGVNIHARIIPLSDITSKCGYVQVGFG